MAGSASGEFEFSTDWFSNNWPNWLAVTSGRAIKKIVEVGSFEGRSACRMIEEFGGRNPLDIYCIDTWAGSLEHKEYDMAVVEKRFDRNVSLAASRCRHPVNVMKFKGESRDGLARMCVTGHKSTFDLVFVDGSHQAADVLCDLVLGYALCAVGGLIICDDYLWSPERHGEEDILNMPRAAIDAFAMTHIRRLSQHVLPLYQAYFTKTA